MTAREWQFDGLVGPTHHYAGLSDGNLASKTHAGAVSNPRLAALQGIEKMAFVRDLGAGQGWLPPQKRPIISVLQQLGFGLGDSPQAHAHTLEEARRVAPDVLSAVFSSSFMWAANAATVIPSRDARDGKIHFIPANLISHLHRAIEPQGTKATLEKIFRNPEKFVIHNPLPSALRYGDEGAANHMVIKHNEESHGIHVFVHGSDLRSEFVTKKYPARQTRETGEAVARLGQLDPARVIHVQQHPDAIDAGVFHNDVIAMNTTQLMVAHEGAFVHAERFQAELQALADFDFSYIEIPAARLSIPQAVKSYLFNSQLLDLPEDRRVLVAPSECDDQPETRAVIRWLQEEKGALDAVYFRDVRESMRNGGGAACLRLRVTMTQEEAAEIHPAAVLTPAREALLRAWVQSHYRDRLVFADLTDPLFLQELEAAYGALEGMW